MSTLSLCLIVRDAEGPLAAALESAAPFVDDMVVVDTGSRDGSRQVATARGARVVEFPWCDDFSAARNYSLAHARGAWIFWMDADDVLPAASGQRLRDAIDACPQRDTAFWVTVEEVVPARPGRKGWVMRHAQVKLFPNHPAIRFQYHVHEQVTPALQRLGIPVRHSGATVQHAHADRTAAGERARIERNLRLALLDLAERPDDPFVWLSLGATYLYMPQGLAEAERYLRQAAAALRAGSPTQLNAYLYLGQALGQAGRRGEEEAVYRAALAEFPDDGSLLLRLGGLCQRQGRWAEAAGMYERLLAVGKGRLTVIHPRDLALEAVLRLGHAYVQLGRVPQAEKLWLKAFAQHPGEASLQHALLELQLRFPTLVVGARRPKASPAPSGLPRQVLGGHQAAAPALTDERASPPARQNQDVPAAPPDRDRRAGN